MKIELNDVVQSFKPWDFVISIDGADYRTMPFTLAMGAEMAALENKGEEDGYKFFENLFEGEAKPPVRQWSPEQATAVIGAIMGYKQELTRKNSQAAAAHVAAAMNSKSGSKLTPTPVGASS